MVGKKKIRVGLGCIPLHPVSMSIPMTCIHGRHDMLFHLVYGENRGVLMEFVRASAQRLYSITENKMLQETMICILNDPESVSLQKSRALFFLLMNVDMPTKQYLCDTTDRKLLAVALNILPVDVDLTHSSVMLGAKPPSVAKLESFFARLSHEIVPNWMQNQSLILDDFVNTVKDEYIIS
jgi:hypothetical protein